MPTLRAVTGHLRLMPRSRKLVLELGAFHLHIRGGGYLLRTTGASILRTVHLHEGTASVWDPGPVHVVPTCTVGFVGINTL